MDSVPLITIYAKKNPELDGIDLYNIFDTNTLGFTKNDVEPDEFPLYDSEHISLICEIEPNFKNNIDAYIEELSAGIKHKTIIPLIINSNPKIRKVVSEYIKSIGNKPNIKALLRTWIQKSKQQCDEMEAAYIDSVVNKKL